MRLKTALLPLTMPMLLAACLGGGGSGGSSSGQSGPLTLNSTPTDFTSFEAITANSLVEASAPTSVNYAADVVGGNVDRLGELSFLGSALRILTGDEIPPEVEGDDPEFEFGGLRLTVNLPGDTTIARDFTEEPTEVGGYGRLQIVGESEAVTDRLYLNEGEDLDYMAFGVWEIGLGEETIDMGGAAWGALTPTAGDNAMPAGGVASYSGELIGYNFQGGATTVYIADSTLGANFDADTVSLTASNTRALIGGAGAAGLDIVASPGTISGNGFSGNAINLQAAVDNPGLDFSGSYGGAFYGPDAAEAGGWFEVRNDGNNDRYFGSFGGARGEVVFP